MSISFWQAQVGLPAAAPASVPPALLDAELCIVGAGIVGAGVAHWAAQQGLSGVVIEARAPAMGASGRNAGFLLSGVADNYAAAVGKYGRAAARELWALSITNRDAMLAHAEALGIPTQRCGSLLLAESEAEAEALAQSAALLAADGFEGEFTAHDPLRRGFHAALRRAGDGVTQPAALSRALLAQSAFALVEGSPVRGWQEDERGVTVQSARATVRARWVVLAVNGWAGRLHPFFEDKVFPMRGQMYATEPAPMRFHTAGYSDFGFWYFRQVPEPGQPGLGRWLMGGGRHRHFETENHNPSEQPSELVQAELHRWTERYFPEFAALPVAHRWAGTMAFTADGLPLVGRMPGSERVAFSVGFNGHGMGLGILVARRALTLLLDGSSPGLFDAMRPLPGTPLPPTP